ncbi:hypothetical protein [Deferribacter autotrophicus]|uniref:hypothetical protein n=1 Tax=Deferribacter autotrophicus TaxID=500465 RepID=UPI00165E4735|nr:hypothetical protein [Deferribacter autotrophicus]
MLKALLSDVPATIIEEIAACQLSYSQINSLAHFYKTCMMENEKNLINQSY